MRRFDYEWLKRITDIIESKRRWLLALSILVVFITTYLLILPAFTLEKDKAAEQGGIDVPSVETEVNANTANADEEDMSAANEDIENAGDEYASDETLSDEEEDQAVEEEDEDREDEGVISEDNTEETADDESSDSTAGAAAEADAAQEDAASSETGSDTGNAETVQDSAESADTKASVDAVETNETAGVDAAETDETAEADAVEDEAEESAENTLIYEGDGFTVTVEDTHYVLPENTELVVEEILENPVEGTRAERKAMAEEYKDYCDQAISAINEESKDESTKAISFAKLYDIKFMSSGEEIKPDKPVNVTITYDKSAKKDLEVSETDDVHIVHFAENEKTEEVTPELLAKESIDVTLEKSRMAETTFEAENFSVYGVIYTVDFHYEINGKTYDFSIPGGGFISLEHLVEVLGIANGEDATETADSGNEFAGNVLAADEAGTYEQSIRLNEADVSDDARKFVSDVESVKFSSPELVWVGKIDSAATVGTLKESNGLKVEYAEDLSEEQVSEINAQTLEAGDWALISLKPFKSEETLTVTMKNGDVFTIKVTDAQIKKTVISASGKTYEVIVAYDDNAQIPEGSSLKITEFAEDSKEYQAAREAVVDKKQSEDSAFDEKEFGIAAFDLTIVDKDGEKVEPKAAVDVSMKMKSMPEEAVEKDAQYSIEIHHLDESSGDVTVENVASAIDGSVQIEEETAQAEFQLESFSTFTVSWNRRSTNNSTTTFGWQDRNNTARGYITAQYQDESGNVIQRPDSVNYTVYHGGFNNGVTNTFNIASELGKSINGYTFTRAYVLVGEEGNKVQQQVDSVTATRTGDVTSVTYYYNGEEVLSASYDATYAQNKRHDFTPDGLGLTLEYTKNNNFTTIHYGYMDGNTFVEFDEQPGPTNTSTSFGWAHLIYDFAGTDDQGLHVDWKYSGTYYHTSETTNPEQGGTAIQPILRYYNNAWRYYNGNIANQNDTRNNNNWKSVANGSDIYVVYEKPVIPMGGTPTPSENSPQPDPPYILKESVSNTDGTNTLSLSVTGSRKAMITEKVADVIVILDLSSSMRRDIGSNTAYDDTYQTDSRSRFYQAKNAVQRLADTLYAVNGTDGEQYRMGLITFSNYAGRTYLTPTENQSEFQTALNKITAYEGSGTNWEHALQLANQMATASDRATYIVFITDGEPSVRQTRGDLTNEQLSGNNVAGQVGNWSYNPNNEGDIFHGGLAGGQFFNRNGDYSTPDFRDYLGSATFGGLMNNDVWDARNRNAAVDEVASMLGHNKGFYAIGVSSDVNYLGDFSAAAGVDENHYKLVTSATAFQEVIDDILEELDISGTSGQANVKVYDGITDLTQTIAKVNKEEGRLIGADGNFKYYKSTAPEGWDTWTAEQKAAYAMGVEYADSSETPTEYASYTQEQKDAYDLGKAISFTEWTTRQADGCAEAVYNTETGAVEWNMGQKFMLEDGVTYKVSFICWPSQEAYDIIAKLNNGTITFGDTTLYPQEIWDQFEGDAVNGYTLKTNAEGANTKYSKATNVNGTITVGDEQDPLPFQHVPPMPLDKDKLNVAKTWQPSQIDSQTPESVVLQVVGGNEIYKQFEITPTSIVDGSATNNYGRSENIYISCGHIKVDRDTGKVVVYESGHDFTLREVEENSRHWDLDASVCRPMKINMEETMLVLVKDENVPAGMTDNMEYYKSGSDEYYRLDGKVYKDTKAWADITGMNTRRSFLDLAKEVLVNDEVWTEEVDEKFTYKITINIDETTLDWDPTIENYIIISIRGKGYTPAAAIADQTYPTTAKLPSQSGMDPSLIHDHYDDLYLVAKSDEVFYLSIKNGWSVRFLNLPAGTTYSIEEVLPNDSDYDFNNVRLETRKDTSSADPLSSDTYQTKKVDGRIAETSTLYKLVYQNEAKTKEVQILKTGQDASTPLGGAKFDLYTESAYTSDPQGTPYKTNLVSSDQPATKGKIDLGKLPIGKYYLVETKAPDGYNMRTDPVVITVSKTSVTYDDGTTLSQSGSGISQIGDVYQLTVTNDEGIELPHTGGPGTTMFYLVGIALVIGSGVILIRRRNTAQHR